MKAQIETLLKRDIHLITQTTVPYENLRNLLSLFAHHQGEASNLTVRDLAYEYSPRLRQVPLLSLL